MSEFNDKDDDETRQIENKQGLLISRRHALKTAVGLACVGATIDATSASAPKGDHEEPKKDPAPLEDDSDLKLRVATCQFPVGSVIKENSRYISQFMREASKNGANLLHTSEASLSGYAGVDFASFDGYDWDKLREETARLRHLAHELNIWLVLGSTHFLDENTKPTNCLYLIGPNGDLLERYDKSFLTGTETRDDSGNLISATEDLAHYSPGNRLVTYEVRGVRVGLAICYDVCWPQIYIGYREQGALLMLHSFHNGRLTSRNCLADLVVRQVATRCADNRLWAVCNNSSQPYSEWGSFVARPDSTTPKRLPINTAGMLVHDFPDGLSPGGWFHNYRPMGKRDEEWMHSGTFIGHPRQLDAQSQP